jgi:hypothetical protein
VYAHTKHPPSCPPSLAGAAPPVVAPGLNPPAGHTPAFLSTFKICYQQLTTRVFNVPDGGVTLQISGDWARRFEDSATACPTDDYEVTLHRSNLLLDDDMGTAPVPVGGQSVEWRELPPGDYYLTIVAPPHSPLCCLQGDLAVSTFSAPPIPLRMDPMDPSMIA